MTKRDRRSDAAGRPDPEFERLSSLHDDELPAEEAEGLVRALREDPSLRALQASLQRLTRIVRDSLGSEAGPAEAIGWPILPRVAELRAPEAPYLRREAAPIEAGLADEWDALEGDVRALLARLDRIEALAAREPSRPDLREVLDRLRGAIHSNLSLLGLIAQSLRARSSPR